MGESENKSSESGVFIWLVIIALIGLVTLMVIPNFIKARVSERNPCINRLRQIDAAIYEWALEQGKTNGTIVTENDIKPYIKLDEKGNIPKCPQGGKYTFGKVGDNPQISCSLSTAVPPTNCLEHRVASNAGLSKPLAGGQHSHENLALQQVNPGDLYPPPSD